MFECVVLQRAVLIGVMQLGFEASVFPICNYNGSLPPLRLPTHKEPIAHAAARMRCITARQRFGRICKT